MSRKIFNFVMIKPSHYDAEGYVIQFFRSAMPSNTLATIFGLAEDCRKRQVLGPDVEMKFTAIDETNKFPGAVRTQRYRLVREIKGAAGGSNRSTTSRNPLVRRRHWLCLAWR